MVVHPRGKRTLLYVTADELRPRLADLESGVSLTYVHNGTLPTNEPITYHTYREIPDLGISQNGDTILDRSFLIIPKKAPIRCEEFRLKSGELRYSFEHPENPMSVIFRPGGVFAAGNAVIQGSVSKLTDTLECEQLYRDAVRYLRKGFMKIKGHWLGPHALKLAKSGFRLTASVRGNPAYDLRF